MNHPIRIAIVVGIFFIGGAAGLYAIGNDNREHLDQERDRCSSLEVKYISALKGGSAAEKTFLRSVIQDCRQSGYKLTHLKAADLIDGKPLTR